MVYVHEVYDVEEGEGGGGGGGVRGRRDTALLTIFVIQKGSLGCHGVFYFLASRLP